MDDQRRRRSSRRACRSADSHHRLWAGTVNRGEGQIGAEAMKRIIMLVFLLLSLAVPGAGQTKYLRYPRCSIPAVELITDTPNVKRGSYPTFTLVLRNRSGKPVHLIDVRQIRWQPFHAALKFLRGGKEVWLTTPISDPPTISPNGNDHFWLRPGGEERFELHYEQDASELRLGRYEAVVVFWNYDLPPAPSGEMCLSNRAKFSVK